MAGKGPSSTKWHRRGNRKGVMKSAGCESQSNKKFLPEELQAYFR